MYWVAVKVLFLRQIYGLRHRWIATGLAIGGAIVLLALLHVDSGQNFDDVSLADDKQTAIVRSAEIQSPFTVVVFPDEPDKRQLMDKAVLKLHQYSLRATFTKNLDEMEDYLENAKSVCVGIHFHEVTKSKLEYTLRPVVTARPMADVGRVSNMADDDRSNEVENNFVSKVQFAIDAGYVEMHHPNFGRLRLHHFQDAPPARDVSTANITVRTVHFYVAIGTMFVMLVFASYIIRDRVSGVRELLCINGVPRWMVNCSWLISFCLLMIIVGIIQAVIVTMPPKNPLLKFTNPTLLVIIFILYGWSAMVSANFAGNLFTSQTLTLVLIFIYWSVSVIVSYRLPKKQKAAQGFSALLPNVGLTLIFSVIEEFYIKKTELSFGNLFSSNNDFLSPGVSLILMLAQMVIFGAVAIYLDFVMPGPYGRARPWYLFTKDNSNSVYPAETAPIKENQYLEKIGNNEPIALECVNLVKLYGTNRAVNNLNLKIIKNRITVLLGHNGAGKTTLFSILCGMTTPTSGNFYTEEYDVFNGNNIRRFCSELGYCPQENLLLNELTVQQHLILFGMLKGLTRHKAREFSDYWTKLFDMEKMRSTQAKNLSGGTKRKLNLAIAMTGQPKYALLDEPSSGMDTESARKMWDILLTQKGKCTVIITTHNMNEAEILGDRIAIMASGQLKCYGTSSFLKQKLDTGYRLNCSTDINNSQDIVKVVQKYVRTATVIYKMNRTVTFGLPSNTLDNIPDLLRGLESQFGDSVASSLSFSTLDDVFVKVQKDEGVKIDVEELPIVLEDDIDRSRFSWGQVEELVMRRVKWLLSSKIVSLIFLVILLPCLATVGSMSSWNGLVEHQIRESRMRRYALISRELDSDSDRLTPTNNSKTNKEIYSTLFDSSKNIDYHDNLQPHIDTTEPPSMDNSASIGYSSLINSLLQGKTTIIAHRSPFQRRGKHFGKQDAICVSPGSSEIVSVLFLLILAPFLLTANVYFLIFPLEERVALFKHLLLMTGLLPVVYWIVNLVFDLLLFICTITVIIIVVVAMDGDIWLNSSVIGTFILLLLLYGVSCIVYAYVWSFMFRSIGPAILMFIMVNSFLFVLLLLLSGALGDYFKIEYAYFIPWAVVVVSIRKLLLHGALLQNCNVCDDKDSCAKLINDPLYRNKLKTELICFGVSAVVYFVIVVALDHGLGRKVMGVVRRVLCGRIKVVENEIDPEVALEKQRVDDLKTEADEEQPQLICDSLGKKYSCKKTAVYDVTFVARRGECFGLVGVNGAGKSTTFGMLAALLTPTKGTASIQGKWSVTGCEYKYLRNIGYCPQYEGLLKGLSARTIIKLFARLRGVSKDEAESLTDKWINALDMDAIAKRPCGTYSGGNKRKLSLAVTIIGNPSVVFLDEPTAGVDSIVRRKIYQILSESLEKTRQTIILTSHAMSECEAICDRLTIMVRGVMKCLGPVAKLKKTFGKSCILQVKFVNNAPPKDKDRVQTRIESRFAAALTLQDKQTNQISFVISTAELKVYDVFASMLQIKSEFPVVDDFNLTETPLEQVFLMFARQQ